MDSSTSIYFYDFKNLFGISKTMRDEDIGIYGDEILKRKIRRMEALSIIFDSHEAEIFQKKECMATCSE